MGYPLGKAPLADGTGTTPADHQRVLGARWANAGIIGGCQIGLSTSAMAYTVAAGAVAVSTGAGLMVEVPVDAITVPTTAAPASGTRRDYLVVTSAGQVVVNTTGAGGTVIGSVIIPAGATAASAGTVERDRRWALPPYASLGRLARWADPSAHGVAVPTALQTVAAFTLPILPTDRLLDMVITQSMYSSRDGGASGAGSGSCQYQVKVDGAVIATIEISYDTYFEPKQISLQHELLARTTPYVVSLTRKWQWGDPGYFVAQGIGSSFVVMDRGGIQ